MSPSVRHIAEFEDYFIRINPNNPSPQDPFYKDSYMSSNQCRLQGVNYDPYTRFPNCVVPIESQRYFYNFTKIITMKKMLFTKAEVSYSNV